MIGQALGTPDHHYLNVFPSKKALAAGAGEVARMTVRNQGHTPLPKLMAGLNRHLEGWANYFRSGIRAGRCGRSTGIVRGRLIRHLKRRSQRPYRRRKAWVATSTSSDLGWYLLSRLSPKWRPAHA